MAVFAAAAFPQKQPETVQRENAEISEESPQTDITTAVTEAVTLQKTETVTTADTDSAEPDSTALTTATAETDSTGETTAPDEASEAEESEDSPEQDAAHDAPDEPEQPAPVRIYRDGTFTATAYGYDGNITVYVTIQDDTITAETEESDDSYFFDAKSAVIPAIIRSQAADVDACSGATYSSNGIMTAVRAALESARL